MRYLLLATALIASAPVLAQNSATPNAARASTPSWYRVGGNENAMSYVDLNSLRPTGGKTMADVETVFKTPLDGDEGIYASEIQTEYNCAGGTFRTIQYTYHAFDGSLIRSEPSETIDQSRTPTKDSINEAIMAFVCNREGGENVSDIYSDARAQFALY